MAYNIGEVAQITRLSLRALRHYDEIGLLQPSARSRAGYRLYSERDLALLQQVLFFRALGFKLDQIRAILTDPHFDRAQALRSQRALFVEQAERAERLLQLIDNTLAALDKGDDVMSQPQMFEGLTDFDANAYAQEAEQRWGNTPEFRESQRRTKAYGTDDWQKMRSEADTILERFANAAEAGLAPSSPEALAIAEAHRQHITRWFYECTRAIHRSLGEMYVSDPRFTAYYDKRRPELALFVREAIVANADRA